MEIEKETEEKNGLLDEPKTWQSPTRTNITTSIDSNIWEIAKQNNIAWKDALEFGIKFLYADSDGVDWPDCNLLEKFHKIVKHRNALLTEVAGLREQVPEIVDDQEDIQKDIDKVFGGLIKNE